MTEKLTAKLLKDLGGPPEGKPYVLHYDSEVPGFGLRITKAGARSFVLNYRARGIERRITIGSIRPGAPADEIDRLITAARKTAAKMKAAAKYDGVDPMAERHEERAARTMADLAERYFDDHLPKKRQSSQSDDRLMINNIILPALKNKRVVDIEYSDIDALHRKITKSGAPTRANRVVSLLSKMFSLAIERWKWCPGKSNPARGVERNPEQRRQRYLTPDELSRVGAALKKHAKRPSANAVRLLLLTGARRGEVLGATWDQFDLSTGIWTKPSSHTKQKKEHRVPLSAPARQLIAQMREDAEVKAKKACREVSAFLFPGASEGKAQAELKHFWATVCEEADLDGVRVHDLRHTYASVLASSGQTLPIIGQLLGHTNPATTARYAHLFDDPLRAATERAAKVIAGQAKRQNKRDGKKSNVHVLRTAS